jgi:uncharacterized protein
MLSGLEFKSSLPTLPTVPQRTDVACFIGFIDRRSGASAAQIPPEVWAWFKTQGWVDGSEARSSDDLLTLRDIPVPIQSWAAFTALFHPETRDWTGQGAIGSTYLATAVRSFFMAGGRKCYVVAVGPTRQGLGTAESRQDLIAKLIPGYPNSISMSALDPASWRGIGHLLGLADVSFVAFPDLLDLVQADPPSFTPPLVSPPPLPEQFVECSQPSPAPITFNLRSVHVPTCDQTGYELWAKAIHHIGSFLATRQAGNAVLREIQLVAAVPLPIVGSPAAQDLRKSLDPYLAKTLDQDAVGIGSAFVQLVYPWVQTAFSHRLPAEIEPPEGLLIGTLAQNALMRGTFRSTADKPLMGVEQIFPQLDRSQLYTPIGEDQTSLVDRVSVIGPTSQGVRLRSDVTTSLDENYRPACLNRLMAAIVRIARHTGELTIFESSSERLWTTIKTQLETLLLGFWNVGALRGGTPAEAFEVRCDRTTMTQADLDNGRVIAQVSLAPAMPITHITVMLTVTQFGVDRSFATLPALQEVV